MSRMAFIGGGNMARSLITGLLARAYAPDQITVAEPVESLRQALAADFGIRTEIDNGVAATDADVILLAVKPQVMAAVCTQLAAAIGRRKPLIISIAAGITLAHFQKWFGTAVPLLRAMPNTPALIGSGACGLYASATVSAQQKLLAEKILGTVGETCWIENENLMDVVTAVSGSGPAYFFLLMEAMIDAAVQQGLSESVARALVLQTALGAARMAKESSETPSMLRQRVTSPNGTTQAALEVFAANKTANTVHQAIARATERGRELSAQFGVEQ